MESRVVENYLKAVFNAREWSEEPVTVGGLATRLSLSPSTVSELVRKLTERGLLSHARYGAIELTPEGQRIALAIVRKHRLIETFLVDYLGYTWDEVHEEAEILEHAVSDTFIDRLASRLGEPDHDPHGDPIPRSDGTLPDDDQLRLDAVGEGVRARVARVSDSDPEVLRQLDQLGITIGTTLTVNNRHDLTGTIDIIHNDTPVALDLTTADAIRVVRTDP
jgi:DtxR family transcriptional regulator, Mn-dependent transcriptional regulator